VIEREAERTRIVIWGKEHHLPQTRSLYEPMLRLLWSHRYRYLGAETFAESVMAPDFRVPTFPSGVYLRDPVYADAVRVARDMGYRLVAYQESGAAPSGDASFGDRRQAENLQARVFARDPRATLIVLAGRGHASEVTAPDGWTPMASVLKRITSIDPFTVFAVRMGERRTSEEEDPQYRFATAHGLIGRPTIFTNKSTGRTLGDESFDAFVFWPRTRIVNGGPDWLVTVPGRRPTDIPPALKVGNGVRLVQAFRQGEPPAESNVAVVDEKSMKTTAHYDFSAKGGRCNGLVLDAKNAVLFVACGASSLTPAQGQPAQATMVIMSARDGKILTTLPLPGGSDGVQFNPATMEAFATLGNGHLAIVKETSPTT
jgi:hypothetical protein